MVNKLTFHDGASSSVSSDEVSSYVLTTNGNLKNSSNINNYKSDTTVNMV